MLKESKMRQVKNEEDSAIRAIFEGTSSSTGTDFYTSLVKNLCIILNTKGGWLTKYFEEKRFLLALAFWYDGKWINHFGYKIDGTPLSKCN